MSSNRVPRIYKVVCGASALRDSINIPVNLTRRQMQSFDINQTLAYTMDVIKIWKCIRKTNEAYVNTNTQVKSSHKFSTYL